MDSWDHQKVSKHRVRGPDSARESGLPLTPFVSKLMLGDSNVLLPINLITFSIEMTRISLKVYTVEFQTC